MNRQLLTIVLILLLLVSWVVIIELARDNKGLSNALKIAEKSLDRFQAEIVDLSNQVDTYNEEGNRGVEWNEESIPAHGR